MAKILISSIGTGNKKDGQYLSATYEIDKKRYKTSFIADALKQHHKFDTIFLVGTKKSIWDEAYLTFGGDDDNASKLYEHLESEDGISKDDLELFNLLEYNIIPIIIDYGVDETQLWANFKKYLEIAENFEDNDDIYLDITHSFRSLSLMSFVMSQFAKTISDKKFKIKAVYYGMLEYHRENNGITPIVDLKMLFDIQEWISAIDAIKKYSDFEPLVNLLSFEDIEPTVQNAFIQLNNSLKIANLSAFEIFIKNASKKIKSISESSNEIIKLLAPEIIKLVDELNHDKKSHFQYNLAKWFYKNKNYAFSYIALYEAIISKSCELKEYDVQDHDLREDAKQSIGNDKYGQYFYTKRGNPKFKDSISNIRNAIAHQNDDRKELVMQDIKRLDEYLKTFEQYIYI